MAGEAEVFFRVYNGLSKRCYRFEISLAVLLPNIELPEFSWGQSKNKSKYWENREISFLQKPLFC
jgi:hypothetical protein